jgi:uncharacterized ion transporter superfamily protein YfcC
MLFFSLAGGTFGFSEEALLFVFITVPMAVKLGYDNLTGVAIPLLGQGIGFAGAFTNPFTIGIAQGIAEVPVFSGWAYRLIIWIVCTTVGITFLVLHMRGIDKGTKTKFIPAQSSVEGQEFTQTDKSFGFKEKFTLIGLLMMLVAIIYGVTQLDWYINEIAAAFIAYALFIAIANQMSTKEASSGFQHGMKDMIGAVLIIGLAKAILVIVEEGKIIDTFLEGLSSPLASLPKAVSINLMFVLQNAINLFLPSGSGQAALTMPIMAPLADLLGITRQSAVLAFQMGDGFSNLIIPTSAVTMGCLEIAKIPYVLWLKWIGKLMILLFVLCVLFLVLPTVFFNYGPV